MNSEPVIVTPASGRPFVFFSNVEIPMVVTDEWDEWTDELGRRVLSLRVQPPAQSPCDRSGSDVRCASPELGTVEE